MCKRHQCLCLLAGIFALLIGIFPACAQTTSGSVTGIITDASGAPVSNAPVNLINLETQEKRTATTTSDGLYTFVSVPPGNYRVQVQQTGFKSVDRQPVVVQTASSTTINIALQLGEVSQTVEVTSQTPLLQTDNAALGEVVDQRQATELPLNGRNPINLAALAPSVVPQGQAMQNATGSNPFGFNNYSINGGLSGQGAILLDGSPLNTAYNNVVGMIPTQDSIQEFKVQTNNLGPEFGRFAGGVINFTTRSGTNDLHGGAWEFLRNKDLNANDFFDNRAGIGRPAFTQNQFGANLGGPVYIPKLYNGRNRTFFFVNWEGFRLRQGTSYTGTVPTVAERAGDFSGAGTTIYDPLTTCGVAAACTAGQSQYDRTAFPGNVIPTNRLNPASLKLLNLYPLPNTTGTDNFTTNGATGGNNNETVVHIDHNISDKQHITARYTYWSNLNLSQDVTGNGVCLDRCAESFSTNNFVFGDTYSVNSTTVIDMRLSYQRLNYLRTPDSLGYDLSSLGWPSSLNSEVAYQTLPVICVSGYDIAGAFCSQGAGSIIADHNDNYRGAGSVSKFLGSHTLQFGGEYMRLTQNYAQTNTPSGDFNFDNGFTSANPLTGVAGNAMASFLLGDASSGSVSTPALVAAQQLYAGLYFNDSWHVTPKLTMTLGVRWEYDGPWTERFNRESYFATQATNPITGNLGAVELVDSPGYPNRSNVKPDWKQFSPRVGLAYQLKPTTIIRAGYGIFWVPNDVTWNLSPNNDPINSVSTPFTSSTNGNLTPANTISNPFPNGIIEPPGRNPVYQSELIGQGITEALTNNPYGYAQQYNLDIQHQFAGGFLFDVAYAGSKGVHLALSSENIDQASDAYLSMGSALSSQVANPYAGVITQGTLSGSTVALGQLLRPFPQYSGVSSAGSGVGNSEYNSLQVKAQKRFSHGASLNVAYTWSKLISDTESVTTWLESGTVGNTVQDSNNLRLERSLGDFDVPQRLVVSYVLDVPVGRGRKLLSNANKFVNGAVGGWGIEGVSTFQSGFPLAFVASENLNSTIGASGQRPNYVPGCNQSVSGSAASRANEWFNTACFTQPAAYTYGTLARTDPSLRAAGIANYDFSAFKNFGLGESKAHIQFRAEFFNIFNRAQFGPPNTTVGNTSFGVVNAQINEPRLVQFALRLAF